MEKHKNPISESDRSVMPKMSSFKDLRKPTMKETYQNLGTFIGKKEIQNTENLKALVLSESALPLFEESLRLSVIDSLQLEKEVVKVLLSQNDRQIKRILSCKWFFKSLPLEFCSSEIFPHVSVSLRCKIITKLSKHLESKEEAEKYFTFIRENYDNERADYLLSKCSGTFISRHFEKHKSLLRHPAQLRILSAISRRYPEVGLHILEHIFGSINNSYHLQKYKRIVQYIAGNHHDLFVPFLRKHHSLLHPETFGQKVTKKLGSKVHDEFLSNVISTLPFKSKVLFSKLPLEERVKFLAKFLCHNDLRGLSLDTWSYSTYEMSKYLKMVKPQNRLACIEGTFKELYNLSFNKNSKYWCRELLELLPLETRKPYLLKLEKFFNQEESVFDNNVDGSFFLRCPERFTQLFEFSFAFEKLKEMLRTAPLPSRRKDIISSMVENCSVNSDLKGLEEVIEFVVTRHRNDESKILYGFIELIFEKFPWTELTPRSYEKLNELFHLCALKSDPPGDVHMRWKERHLYHLMEYGLDVDAQLKNYFENFFLERPYGTFLVDYNCRHSKTLLMKLCHLAVKKINAGAKEALTDNLLRLIVYSCARYSDEKRNSDIWREVPELEELLLEKLRSKYREMGAEEWPFDIVQKYHNDIIDSEFNANCLRYVLIRKPELIDKHLEGFLNCLISKYGCYRNSKNCFSSIIKAASFYEKTETVKEILLRQFKTGKSCDERKRALLLYSQISTIEEFSKAVEEYLPKQEKIEPNSDVDFTKIQLFIPNLIKNIRPRWKNFNLILKFFLSDFLKSIRLTLHACSHYTRVDVVVPFLKEHFDTLPYKISYQKDVIRLIAELSTRDETIDFCLAFWKKYTHYTIRTILFHFVSKLFVEQPTRDSLEVVKKCVMEADPIVITKMPKLEMVADEFLEEHVDALMRFSEGQSAAFRNDFQKSIISHFHGSRIRVLSAEFSERIIRKYLFNPKSELDVRQFVGYYLTQGPNSLQSRVRMVFDLINQNKPSPMDLLWFLDIVKQRSKADLTAFGDLFAAVLDNWPEYPLGVLYEERVMFTYWDLHRKACQDSPDPELQAVDFAKKLRELYSRVDNLSDVVFIYGHALNKFLENFEIEKAVSMVKELVRGSKDRNVALVGTHALPKKAIYWFWAEEDPLNEVKTKQRNIMNDLLKVFEGYDDKVVEIFVRRKFYVGD